MYRDTTELALSIKTFARVSLQFQELEVIDILQVVKPNDAS